MSNAKRNPWLATAINMLLLLGALYFLSGIVKTPQSKEVLYSEFLAEVRSDQIKQVQITDKKLIGVLKQVKKDAAQLAEPSVVTATRLPGIDEAALLKDLEAHGVEFLGSPPPISAG